MAKRFVFKVADCACGGVFGNNTSANYHKRRTPVCAVRSCACFAKNSKPDSMPSRHTASAFIIAMAILRFNVWAGIAYLFIAVMISVSRVCAGVHYVRDVIVGAAIAILCGIVFLFLVF